MVKVKKIRVELDVHPMYQPTSANIHQPNNFVEMSEEEERKVINSMATKSCDIDPVPTNLLKKSLEGMLHIIMKIINLSLTQGFFVSTWKTAVV